MFTRFAPSVKIWRTKLTHTGFVAQTTEEKRRRSRRARGEQTTRAEFADGRILRWQISRSAELAVCGSRPTAAACSPITLVELAAGGSRGVKEEEGQEINLVSPIGS
jgi:hypothetical protein